jgi:hypothetical protein
MIMSEFQTKCHLYQTARIKTFPSGTGYVKIKNVDIIAGLAMFWVVGLDSNMKGHYAIFDENQLDEFCL